VHFIFSTPRFLFSFSSVLFSQYPHKKALSFHLVEFSRVKFFGESLGIDNLVSEKFKFLFFIFAFCFEALKQTFTTLQICHAS
jgi:hypothetical protein